MATLIADATNVAAQFAALKDGDTLKLQGTILDWRPLRRAFPNGVTIDAREAVIGGIYGATCEGLHWLVNQVTVGKQFALGLRFDKSKRITIDGFRSTGSADLAKTYGISMLWCEGVTIRDFKASGFKNGIVLGEVSGFAISRVEVSGLGSDGIDLYGAKDGYVEDVYAHGFTPIDGAHPDLIQFASQKGGIRCDNVRISRVRGHGPMQGVCGFNHPDIGQQGFGRILVEDVDLELAFPQGCSFYDTDDLTLRNVTVRTIEGSKWQSRIFVQNAKKLTRSGSATLAYDRWKADIDADWKDPRLAVPPAPKTKFEDLFTAEQVAALDARYARA